MNRFAERSAQTELIDEPGIPFRDWEVCLRELNAVNTYLGGHAITLAGVKQLWNGRDRLHVAEIGCGGGDNLKAIHKVCNHKEFSYTGIDINKACTDFARDNCSKLPGAHFICSDYRLVNFGHQKPDIIFNSLFCHHFSNDALIEMLRWMKENSNIGFFINDLQRHPVAFHSIRMLTRVFSRSYLVKHDAPVSVSRGFKKNDWTYLMAEAGINNYTIEWRWAFRYLVIVNHA